MTDERRPWTGPQIAAAVAIVLALGGAALLLLWPCAYSGVRAISSAGGIESATTICKSFLEVNGASAALILLIPGTLAAIGLVGARVGAPKVFIGATVVLFAFCFLAALSVGVWFLPAAIAMLIAVMIGRRPPSARSLRRKA